MVSSFSHLYQRWFTLLFLSYQLIWSSRRSKVGLDCEIEVDINIVPDFTRNFRFSSEWPHILSLSGPRARDRSLVCGHLQSHTLSSDTFRKCGSLRSNPLIHIGSRIYSPHNGHRRGVSVGTRHL